MTRRIRFDSLHGQPETVAPLAKGPPQLRRTEDGRKVLDGRQIHFVNGETKEVDETDAAWLLSNPNFVDADDEGKNRNFTCAVCGVSTLAAAGFPTPQNRIVWYRDGNGRPLCVEDFLAVEANRAWRLWHEVAFGRGDKQPSKKRIEAAIAEAATVEPSDAPMLQSFEQTGEQPTAATFLAKVQRIAQLSELVDVEHRRDPINASLMQMFFLASDGEALGISEAGYPEQKFQHSEADVRLEIRPPGAPSQASPELREQLLREIFALMDERDYDTWIIMDANWVVNRDVDGGAWITRNMLLQARGVKRATRIEHGKSYSDGFKPRARSEAAESLERLQSVVIHIDNVRTRGNKKAGPFTFSSRSFSVTDTCSQRQLKGFGEDEVEAWYYQPGKAFRALGTDARRLTIAQAILKLDPRRQRWEKRLAQFWANNLRPSGWTTKRIGDILDTVRLHSSKNPERDRSNFVTAMNELEAIGAVGGWRYMAPHKLGDESDLPARGGHKRWLGWAIEVSPPQVHLSLNR